MFLTDLQYAAFSLFFGFMVSTVALMQQLTYGKEKDTDDHIYLHAPSVHIPLDPLDHRLIQ